MCLDGFHLLPTKPPNNKIKIKPLEQTVSVDILIAGHTFIALSCNKPRSRVHASVRVCAYCCVVVSCVVCRVVLYCGSCVCMGVWAPLLTNIQRREGVKHSVRQRQKLKHRFHRMTFRIIRCGVSVRNEGIITVSGQKKLLDYVIIMILMQMKTARQVVTNCVLALTYLEPVLRSHGSPAAFEVFQQGARDATQLRHEANLRYANEKM